MAWEAVARGRLVAEQEPGWAVVGPELLGDGVDGGGHEGVVPGDEPDDGQHEQAGVQAVVVIRPAEPPTVDAPFEDLVPGFAGLFGPSGHVAGEAEPLPETPGPVKGNPCHGLGVHEVAGTVADLPDAAVRLPPVVGHEVGEAGEVRPLGAHDVVTEGFAGAQAVEQLAVAVELQLPLGTVADPHRPRPAVALDVIDLSFGEVGLAADAVEDTQRHAAGGGRFAHPPGPQLGFGGAAELVQGVEGEAGVAQPGIAVVPIAHAADLLWQRRGDRRHHRPGGCVGQELEGDRRPHHLVAPRPLVADAGHPVPPRRPCPVQHASPVTCWWPGSGR